MTGPLTLLEASSAVRRGDLTPLALVADCADRVNRLDTQIHAWVLFDQSGAVETAERLTRELADGKYRGPLHGIPIGIKDMFDVAGMPTRCGSPLTDPRPAVVDAPVVARLRAAGAIILGKTVTAEFACFDPAPTRNPWNLAHTPGGSSSGSAAAVAVAMCFGAIGSQTGGSITRPASYCGIAGCKPTFGRVSRRGAVPVSFHLDHVGPIARTVADCGVLLEAIAGYDPQDPASPSGQAAFQRQAPPTAPPRLGIMPDYFMQPLDAEATRATSGALDVLRGHGAQIVELALPSGFDRVHLMHRRIMAFEAAEYHRQHFGAPRPSGYGPNMASLLDEGFRLSQDEYRQALAHQVSFIAAMAITLQHVDALLTPATPEAAPASLASTGDPRFNSPWSYAHVPTVSFPFALSSQGMPLALQLVGPEWSDARVLAIATWCEQKLGFQATPALANG